jgi:hypothetical protein
MVIVISSIIIAVMVVSRAVISASALAVMTCTVVRPLAGKKQL